MRRVESVKAVRATTFLTDVLLSHISSSVSF